MFSLIAIPHDAYFSAISAVACAGESPRMANVGSASHVWRSRHDYDRRLTDAAAMTFRPEIQAPLENDIADNQRRVAISAM